MNVVVARTAKIVDPIAALASEDSVGAEEAAPPESSAAPAVSAAAAVKPPYPPPAPVPTQQADKGIQFDFNDGCRVGLPEGEYPWRVRLSDLDTGNVLYETEIKAGRVNSSKRYFVRFRLEVWQQGDQLLAHDYSAQGRDVLVRLPVETLGDPLGWFPYAAKFKERHGCRLSCVIPAKLMPLLRPAYPDVEFLTEQEVKPERYYASYTIAVYFLKGGMYEHLDYVPTDYRFVGLHRAAGYILGVDPTEAAPRIALADATRPIAEPYVCIAAQSTMQAKYWNNPTGWRDVVRFLKDSGYRVICIDQKSIHGQGLVWNHMPQGAE